MLWHLILVLVVLALAPTSSHASETSGLDEARELFERGRMHQDQQQWSQASALYKKAIGIKDTPGLRFRLGYCEQKLGRLTEAMGEFQRAQQLLDAGVTANDVAELLPGAMAELSERTPRLQLLVPNAPVGLSLEIDGQSIAENPLDRAIPLNPGRHTLRVTAPDHEVAVEELELKESEQRTLKLSLKPRASHSNTSAALQADQPAGSRSGPSTAKVVFLAAEAAVITAGLSLGIAFAQKRRSAEQRIDQLIVELDALENSSGSCRPASDSAVDLCRQLDRAHDDRREAGAVSNVAFIGAGVGAAAALLTYFAWPNTEPAHVGLTVTPEASMLSWTGSF